MVQVLKKKNRKQLFVSMKERDRDVLRASRCSDGVGANASGQAQRREKVQTAVNKTRTKLFFLDLFLSVQLSP